MARYLVKTEPSEYSFENLTDDKKCVWSGVKNPTALKNIRSMKKGEEVFVYHTGTEKRIVGIAKIVSEPYRDPNSRDERLVVVDLSPVKKLKNPVSLTAIKNRKEFKQFPLVTNSRLSVMPVTDTEWDTILSLSQ